MDTISFNLITKNNEDLQTLALAIGTRSWCEISNTSSSGLSMTIKLSYPRAFNTTNAYLITSSQECLQVHKELINSINEYEYQDSISINLIRVDIPFTYLMDAYEEFNEYTNVFKYISEIYSRNNPSSGPKAIMEAISEDKETYLMGNSSYAKKSAQKLTIYNQYKRFQDTHRDIPNNYPDLKRRIRLEVCKIITRTHFTLDEFEKFDIFREYFTQYKKYLLDNALNLEILDRIQREEVENLRTLLTKSRNKKGFTYKNFIYENLDLIKDYKVLREAVSKDLTPASFKNANTALRKAIKEVELNKGIIIMETHKKLISIRKNILSTKLY